MIRRTPELDAFELRYLRDYPLHHQRNMQLYEVMYQHAVHMGVLPAPVDWEALEEKIRFIRRINGLRTPPGWKVRP